MKKAKKYIVDLDNYGSNIHFTFNGKDNANSFTGGIATIIYYVAALLVFCYNLYQFIYNNKPIISFTASYRNSSEINMMSLYAINHSLFLFEQNEKGIPRLMDIDMKDYGFVHMTGEIFPQMQQTVETIGNFYPCSESIGSNIRDSFGPMISFVNISNVICLKIDKPDQPLGGSALRFTKSHEYYGQVALNLCASFQDCYDANSLKQKSLTNRYKMISIVQNTFTNFTERDGYSTSFDTFLFDMDLMADYTVTITLTKNTMSTDRNILFNFQQNEDKIYYTSSMKIEPTVRLGATNTMNINYKYVYDSQEIIYFRSYMKIDLFLAGVFSIVQTVSVILSIICKILNYGYLNNILANELLFFKKEEEEEEKNKMVRPLNQIKIYDKKIKNNDKQLDSLDSNNKLKSDNSNEQVIKNNYVHLNTENLNEIKNKFKSTEVKHEFGLFVYILCKKKKKRIFDMAEEVQKMFDIINIQRNLIQVDYIKQFLFDKSQLNLLSMLNKKLVIENSKQKHKVRENNYKDVKSVDRENNTENNHLNDNIINFLNSI